MSFLAACPFCGRQVQAPSGAMGQSIPCKKCGSSFTLAPHDELLKPVGAAKSQLGGARPAPAARPSTSQAETAEHAAVGTVPETPALPLAPAQVVISRRAPWNLFAVAALVLGGAAAGSATVVGLHWAIVPLCGLGLVAVALCLVVAPPEARRDAVIVALGGLVSVGVLATTLLFPGAFGIEDTRNRPPETPPERDVQHKQPRQDALGVGGLRPERISAGEWIEADRYDVQHDDVQVGIVAAAFKDPPGTPPDARRKERDLHVTVKFINVGPRSGLNYQPPTPDITPRLTDVAGKSFALQERPATPSRDLVSFKPITDTFVFTGVPVKNDGLRLEIPAALIGGSGHVRWQLSRSLIGGK